MFNQHPAFIVPLALLALACSDAPGEPPAPLETPNQIALSSPTPSATGDIPGFLISFERALFDPGVGRREFEEFGFRKVSGAEGTYAHDPITGLILAKPKATAQAQKRPPFGNSLAEHGDRVRAYFIGAGLPTNEMAAAHGSALMSGGGSVDDPSLPQEEVEGYFSVISRQVNGILVADSRAVACINADGAVVYMMLHWPRIPSSVVASAERMRTSVSSNESAFRSRLPVGIDWPKATARVAIRHFPGYYRKGAYAYASYDVSVPGPQGERHFDESGAEFRLPSEL